MALASQNLQLSDLPSEYSKLRTGTVVSVFPSFVLVTVGSTRLSCAYIRQAAPVIGDVVQVVRQGATWFCLGTSSASGANQADNPSFETVNDDGTPAGWTLYNITNTSSMQAVVSSDAVDGTRVLELTGTASTGTSMVTSAPIPVTVGAQLQLAVYVNGLYPSLDLDPTTDVGLYATWYAAIENTYPTTSSADTAVATRTDIGQGALPVVLSGTVTVPSGAAAVRLGLRTVADAGRGAHYDVAYVRRI